ncbi:MAG: acetylxylan esterase [Planctomycetaceae bacterium]|nr:acetylxylan esterase [Planctomycetaceae bacterium]
MAKRMNVPQSLVRCSVLFLALALTAVPGRAQPPRVLPPGEKPDDVRLGDLKNLNGYFPFVPPKTAEIWQARSGFLGLQLKVACGLHPMPGKTPANAVVHGLVDRGEYTVERVYLQSFPGHFVTGSLYRPKGKSGKLPGVLCPHGHWADGRFYEAPEAEFKKQLEAGAEKFDPSGRYPLQARCVQLARMGCIVFHYDMVGYADSQQLAHRPGLREAMNTAENWGYFSPQAELRLQNMMGLQTYNSIRALDWFETLPDVDPQRIAVTGASGGGTQTFILCAVDTRPAVAFPAVMVSTAMQGGCTCENACYLRVTEGNIGIAGLIAPRPLGMTAADDWTVEIATKGLPELKALYTLLGHPDLVEATPLTQFPHNYNYPSRAVMYHWLNQHLKLGLSEDQLTERDFDPLTREQLTVWDDAHPQPEGGDDYERSLLKWVTSDWEKQIGSAVDTVGQGGGLFQQIVGGGVAAMFGRGVVRWKNPDSEAEKPIYLCADFQSGNDVTALAQKDTNRDGYVESTLLIASESLSEQVPAVLLRPDRWNRQVAIWVSPQGKAGAYDAEGKPVASIRKLLDAGVAVLAIDLFGQGEFTDDGNPIASARINESGRGEWAKYAGYTFGYNYPVFTKRVHDILTAVAWCHTDAMAAERVHLVGLAGAGRWVAAARALCYRTVDRAVVDTGGFRFASIDRFDHPDFLPGGAKYLDLPGMLALNARDPLWLAGEGEQAPAIVSAAYEAAKSPENFTVFDGTQEDKATAAIDWLLQQ